MLKKSFTVKSEKGLTSRASAALVSEANKFKCELRLICEDEVADLKSIMNIMGLVVKKGMIFTVTAEGIDEDCVLDKIENILKDTRVI